MPDGGTWARRGSEVRDEAHGGELAPRVLPGDRTERSDEGEALQADEARFRELFDQAPVMFLTICTSHGQPVVIDANPLFLATLGYERDEVIGRPLLDFYSPRSRAALRAENGFHDIWGERAAAQARQLLTRDGGTVEVLLWYWPENDAQGGRVGSRIACVDVTAQMRTEEALRQSEERFRTAFEHAAIGMSLVDPDGHILQANAALCALTGYTEPELLSRTVQDITHPDDVAVDCGQVQQLLAGTIRSYQVEKRYLRKDGETVWLRLSASLERDARGAPLHLIGQIEDVTARKRAEQELRASEERYRQLVDHLPAAVYLLAADENQTPLYYSPYIEKLTGETPAEAQSLQGHWLALVHPDDRARIAAEDQRTTAAGEIFQAEYRYRCKNGDYVWLRDSCVPLKDAAGRLLGWHGFMMDISDQVRLEALETESRTRQEERDQLQVILDHLPVGILILREADGQVEQANATAIQMIFGGVRTPRTLPMHRRDFRLVWAERTLRTRYETPGARALAGELMQSEQLLLETVEGRLIPVLAHAAPLPVTAEGVSRSVLVVQDVTRLREAEQLKDDFMALVSHEFRTPLTAIHGGAHLLHTQSSVLDDDTRAELLRDIVIESDRLERRLRNILNLTAIMAGQLAVETEPVMLGALVQEVIRELAVQLPQHTLHLYAPPGAPPAEADPALLTEVLTNLYENAAKYSPEGSAITTSIFTAGQMIVLEVSDPGVGFAPEQAAQVFERFHRAGADPTVRGMGLGLYLSRHLIEAQGGALTARSPGPGQGATFVVTLPIAREWVSQPAMP